MDIDAVPLYDILIWAISILGWLTILIIIFGLQSWLFDYRFSPQGVKFVGLGGRITLGHLARHTIKKAKVVSLLDYSDVARLWAVRMPNRLVKRFLLIETDDRWHNWTLTPADPDKALSELT